MSQVRVGGVTSDAVPARSGSGRALDMIGRSFPALTLLAWLALAVSSDLPVSSALKLLIALLLTQVLPGVLVWRAVRPLRGSWFEDLAVGFAIGSVIAIAAQIVAVTARVPWLSTGISIGVVIVMLAAPLTRRRILEAQTSWEPWWFGPLVSLVTVAGLQQILAYFQKVPLTWAGGFRSVHVDAYYHLSLAGELAHRAPATFPWVASEQLSYHWFSHAWVANLSTVAGVGLDQTLFRFMPVVLPLAVALIVATAAVRITSQAWTGPVAALLTLAGGDLNVFGQPAVNYPLDPLSPSLGLSVPMLVALLLVLVCRWRGEARSGAFVLVPVLAIAVAGTKGSALPLVVAGLMLSVAAALVFNRSRVWRLVLDLVVVGACLEFAIGVIFHGSEAGLALNFRAAVQATPLVEWLGGAGAVPSGRALLRVAVVVLFFVLARGAGLLLLLVTRQGRRDPLTWFLAGGGLAGAGAAVAFAQAGDSQAYFAYNAIPLLALGSTAGLASLAERMGSRVIRPLVIGLVAGVLVVLLPSRVFAVLSPAGGIPEVGRQLKIAAVVLVVAGVVAALTVRPPRTARLSATAMLGALVVALLTGGVVTVANTPAATPQEPPQGPITSLSAFATSRDQIDAARWIRDHSSVDDLVMSNRHCISPIEPYRCDSRRYLVAAFSERQVLLEGWTGTPRATSLAPLGRASIHVRYWKPELLALNDGFVAKPDAGAAARLSRLGVRWVYVDFTRPHASTLEPFARLRYRNPGVAVYELPVTR